MPGFIITIESNAKVWYLLGTILSLILGIGLSVAGFVALGSGWGISGIIVAVASVILVVDAIMNFT